MLTDMIRQLAAGAYAAPEFLFGTVKTASPLSVAVDQRFTLPEEALLLPEHLETLTLRVKHRLAGEPSLDETFTLQPGLAAGDRVMLLAAGGVYLILDRVGTPGRVRAAIGGEDNAG